MDGRITGNDIRPVAIGGRLYEMRPLTPRMVNDMIAEAKARSIKEFFASAKAAGLPFDIVSAQIRHISDTRSADELINPLSVAYLLWLRVRHKGVELAEIEEIPQHELLAHQDEILDQGGEEDGGDAAGE